MKNSAFKNNANYSNRIWLWSAVVIILCVAYLLILPLPTNAQDDAKDKQAQLLIPPNQNGPTEVYVDIGISEVFAINEREETYIVDAYMILSWDDARLAFDPEAFGYDTKTFQDEAALEAIKTDIWMPTINLVDGRGARDRMNTSLTIYENGQVDYVERFAATIEQAFNLNQFPFDDQEISFTIQPYAYAVDEVVFVPFEEVLTDGWETEEWDIQYHPILIDSNDQEDDFASATASLTLTRIPNFYVTSFILPLLLIVTLSWAVFWMEHDINLAEHLSISFTSVLTVVAFDFLSTDSLPKLAYPTILDKILTTSYIFLALTIVQNVVSASLVKRDNDPAAQKVDEVSRWLFPLTYYTTLAIIFFVNLTL